MARMPVATLRRRIQRGCTNRAVRDVLLSALKAGAEGRTIKSGVMLYGPNGKAVTAHFTQSPNSRSDKNLLAELRATGLEI